MGIDPETFRRESRESWDRAAGAWERRHDWLLENTRPVSDGLMDRVDARPGQTVLELASGTGDLGFRIAERVGAGGRVISTDFSPEMVAAARRQSGALGLANVEHRALDAERMEIGDDSVDAVACRFGYMLMGDPAAALRETRRVLRDGGPLAFCVWITPDRNPWAALPFMTMVQRGHVPPPEPGTPGMFAMGDVARIRELAGGAGFAHVDPREVAFEMRYADFEDYWDALVSLAGPMARAIQALDDEERGATRDAVERGIAPFRAADGSYSVPAATWVVLAR